MREDKPNSDDYPNSPRGQEWYLDDLTKWEMEFSASTSDVNTTPALQPNPASTKAAK
jgi:hypothetical protein